MLPAAAGVDHDPPVRAAEKDAVPVGAPVRGKLPREKNNARGDLRPGDQNCCQAKSFIHTASVRIRRTPHGVP